MGGTNFGFMAGANADKDKYEPDVTSYGKSWNSNILFPTHYSQAFFQKSLSIQRCFYCYSFLCPVPSGCGRSCFSRTFCPL